MSIKLQINSKAALERLIGGDTELEMEIRNNIVQEFTSKRLKGLINAEFEKKIIDQSLKEMFEQFNSGFNGSSIRLSKKQESIISSLIEQTIRDLIQLEIEEYFKNNDNIKKLVGDCIEYTIWNTVQKVVNTKLEESLKNVINTDVEKAIKTIVKQALK